MTHHESVLLKESVEYLSIKENGIYVDATLGAGGHSKEILKNLRGGHLYSFDQDNDAIEGFKNQENITIIKSNFRFLKNFLKYYNSAQVDGILADLGISSHHIETPERGFSFRFDAPLDMRMNTSTTLSAMQVVNEYEINKIYNILSNYGEVQYAKKIANAIDEARQLKQIETTFDLAAIVSKFAKPGKENSLLSQVFQAIRIEVNQELGALDEFLEQSYQCLKPNGRLVIIAYHSLEDRIVKKFLKQQKKVGAFEENIMGQRQMLWKDISKGTIPPSDAEIKRNPSSRSAKMRVGEKI